MESGCCSGVVLEECSAFESGHAGGRRSTLEVRGELPKVERMHGRGAWLLRRSCIVCFKMGGCSWKVLNLFCGKREEISALRVSTNDVVGVASSPSAAERKRCCRRRRRAQSVGMRGCERGERLEVGDWLIPQLKHARRLCPTLRASLPVGSAGPFLS